jgi:initiation factor 1A
MSSIGGKNYKRIKKQPKDVESARYIISKSDFEGSIYAKVSSMLGSGRLLALGEDNKTYNCVIRGRLYKKVWIKKDDYLIIDPRGYEKKKVPNADVLHRLGENEVHHNDVTMLFAELELPANNPGDFFEFDTTTTATTSSSNANEFDFDKL